jgi:type IV pilus assembly protein PilY1
MRYSFPAVSNAVRSVRACVAALAASLALATVAFGQTMDLSNTPITGVSAAKPNMIFGLDDSGSMDFEVMVNTNDGALWWNTETESFWDKDKNSQTFGKLNFNDAGAANDTWKKYVYLFPNGTGQDTRILGDAANDHFAIPPTREFAFLRSSDYNPIYYNPKIIYAPWAPAYIGTSTVTFANAKAREARSHPVFPSKGTATTMDLTKALSSRTSNWTFRMLPGMTIPFADIKGIEARLNGTGKWLGASDFGNANYTIADGEVYDVNIPYVPATYYVKDPTCTSGRACAQAPDGTWLKRVEITGAKELQNFANWFTYYRKRRLMLAGAMGEVFSQVRGLRGGLMRFNARGADVTMVDFDLTSDADNYRRLLGDIYQNPANSGTPTRDALDYIGKQFQRTGAGAPVEYACQVNAAMILTDGFANSTSSVSLPSYDRKKWGADKPYTPIYDNTLADIALFYYGGGGDAGTLRSDLDAVTQPGLVPVDPGNTRPDADKNAHLHMNTYGLTLGAIGTIYGTSSQSYTVGPYSYPPDWPNPDQNRSPTAVDDLWHAAINGRGQLYTANDVTGTVSSIQAVVANLLTKAGAGAAVAVSNINLRAGDNTGYASVYNPVGWSGDLQAFAVDIVTGNPNPTPLWSAQTRLGLAVPANRAIATYDPVAGAGIPFEWGSLTGLQRAALQTVATQPSLNGRGQDVLNFLRGDRTLEGNPFRTRNAVLGDIVGAEPVAVRGAAGAYGDTGYAAFAASLTTRTPVVYQGANDGMLHVFDAKTGDELWAYVPSLVFARLSELASPNYQHRFYVDGTPAVGDVDFANAARTGSAPDWRTVLVGSLRGGGRGFFALDITNPNPGSAAAAAGQVLWEFPNANTRTDLIPGIGFSYGKPLIVKTAAFGWVVVVTSGYNAPGGDGRGRLYFLDPSNGNLLKELATPDGVGSVGSPLNLGQISGFLPNGSTNLIVDSIYGGDNQGNLWRFDVADADSSKWAALRLARFADADGNPQPITSAPELTVVRVAKPAKRVVVVGTGRLLGASDVTNTAVQSIYAVVDDRSGSPEIANPRTSLTRKTLTVGAGGVRSVNSDAIDWSGSDGWYFDLPAGERVVGDPLLVFNVVVFTGNLPSATACSAGGFLYAVDVTTGGQLPPPAFATGEQPWTGKFITQSMASRPVVVVLPGGGQIKSLTRSGDAGIVSNRLPVSAKRSTRKVGWKEIYQ